MTLYVPHRYRFKWSAVADLTVVPTSCVDPLGPHLHDRREIAAQKTRRPRPPQPVPTDPAERSIERVAERKKGTTRANRPRPPPPDWLRRRCLPRRETRCTCADTTSVIAEHDELPRAPVESTRCSQIMCVLVGHRSQIRKNLSARQRTIVGALEAGVTGDKS